MLRLAVPLSEGKKTTHVTPAKGPVEKREIAASLRSSQ
jgi:hypothetical protein